MKQCPACNLTYTDDALLFCLEDGTQLQDAGPATAETLISYDPNLDPNKTLAFTPARETSPPPTNPYPAQTTPPSPAAAINPSPGQPVWSPPAQPQQYAPAPAAVQPERKSGGKGWIIAGIAAVLVLGIGIVVLLAVVGRDNSNSSSGANSSTSGDNKSANNDTRDPGNANRTSTPPAANHLTDDFSAENWPTGDIGYGSFYEDGEYHMKGRPNLYVYMFPRNSASYASKDADVKVTARSVDGKSPEDGYGLVIHGKISQQKNLEGYGFLVYTGTPAKFQIVRFVEGVPKTEVSWTTSNTIRSGTSPNQLQVLTLGSQLSFYINGQFVKSITDTSGLTEGFVGLYTSQTNEVAFDDMEIDREKASAP